MKKEFEILYNELKKKRILVDKESLRKHVSQGFMSVVYVIHSNKGDLILHSISPVQEWKKQKIWEKLKGVADILNKYNKIPTSEIFFSKKIGNRYFLAQRKLRGQQAGKRLLTKRGVKDLWIGDKANTLIPEIMEIAADIHKINCKGYGWPILKNREIRGQYKTWKQFFEKEIPVWLQSIKKADIEFKNKKLQKSLGSAKEYTKYFLNNFPKVDSSQMIHGDIMNPSNILVYKNKISGVLDWEWSIFGDPAWEFCDAGWWPWLKEKSMTPYFKKYGVEDKKEFIRRVELYKPLWIIWGCHLHSDNPKGKLYGVLRAMLEDTLKHHF